MKNKKILIVDCDGLCWQSFHAMPYLSDGTQGTQVIYGFLNHVMSIQEFEEADRVVFAWDSRSSKRIEIFPEYKLKRRNKKKEYTPKEQELHKDRLHQFVLLREEILPSLGFRNVFMSEGFEGDDIIASVAIKHRDKNIVKIIARDMDLYQLINENCVIYDPRAMKVMDRKKFYEKYGIYPDRWADTKSIAGCSTDEVPGIFNVGEDRAISYLTGKMKPTSVLYKRIEENPDIIKFTRRLVELPLEGTPSFKLKKNKCTIKKFEKVCKKYKLKSFLSDREIGMFRRAFINNGNSTKGSTKTKR